MWKKSANNKYPSIFNEEIDKRKARTKQKQLTVRRPSSIWATPQKNGNGNGTVE